MSEFEVILGTTGDRATAPDREGALRAARQLCEDVSRSAGAYRIHRRDVIVTRGGRYDGDATAAARVS